MENQPLISWTRRRRWPLLAGALVLAVIVSVAVPAALSYRERTAWAAEHGCTEGPLHPQAGPTPQDQPGQFPYGKVHTCRVLDRSVKVFDRTDASIMQLIGTDQGLVLLRVDYVDTNAGRPYRADAWELTGAQRPDLLTDDEARRLATDIAARGGVRPEAWVLEYGDG